jgi:hypothetical protein
VILVGLAALLRKEWLHHTRRGQMNVFAGQLDTATADYDQAIELGGRDQMVDWYLQKVVDCLARDLTPSPTSPWHPGFTRYMHQ